MIQGRGKTEATYRSVYLDSSSSLKDFSLDRKKYHRKYILHEVVEDDESKAAVMGRIVETLLMEKEEFDNRFYMSVCLSAPTGLMLAFVEALYKFTIEATNEDADEDYRLARKTFRELINKGNSAMENLTDLAKESESPRAYEVLSTMMKTIADTTKDLYDLQKKTKDLKKEDKMRPQDEQRINVEKAVFVGSTAELLKKVKSEQTE